jgi:hypothetical protein
VRSLQSRAPQKRRPSGLQKSSPQTKAGLIARSLKPQFFKNYATLTWS